MIRPLIPLCILLASTAPASADSDRGHALFENHCTGCHHPMFLDRPTRHARSLERLRDYVARWAGEVDLDWSGREHEDVVEYLNWRYYQFRLKP